MSQLNFLPRATPLEGWRLALLVVGALALLPAGFNWLTQYQAIHKLESQLEQAQPRRITRPALAPAQQKELDLQIKAVADAVRQLNLPVARLIKTIQPPRDVRVALLALDLSGQQAEAASPAETSTAAAATPSGTLKIAAEAETAQDMINYLAFLNQQPMFRSVYLVKHEMANASNAAAGQNPDGSAERPYHFQLEAQWRQ
jgi:hypothetical protein